VLVLTGAPGAGKSSAAGALTSRLAARGVEHATFETEQLAWGHPWLDFEATLPLVRGLLDAQRTNGRDRFVLVATTETDAQLDALLTAVGPVRALVAALRVAPETVRERILAREPASWDGRERLAAHAAALAQRIPALRGIDVVIDAEDERPEDVAAALEAAADRAGLLAD
jgi:adenylate kinase family enzyme